MCGIAGILDLKGRAVEQPLLERLCACLAHRGPDDEGFHVEGNVALGQRRLSIIDLSSGGQPMSNEDGTVWVTFNGEIYNFLALRAELEAHGHRFATRSDTEVIVHAFEQYGTGCLQRFRGMFAFAIWDQKRRLLFLARDRVGKKPLFYARADGQFVFASELQALLQHPGVRCGREPDPAALDEYLTYGYIPAPGTAFRNVFKLPPAHFLTLELPEEEGVGAAEPKVEPYWRLEYTPKLDLDEDEAAEGLLEVLTEAVRLRLIADVPLGALLSGGVDSSVVVALMSRLSDRPVKTFSIGFDEKAFNELPYARLVARRYGTDHHELIVRARALDVLPTLVRHYGEPFADSSAVPSYHVAQLTRRHVTVALNGDGGDECFAGYERYLGSGLAERYQRIPRPVRVGMIEPLAALIPGTLPRRNRLSQAKRFLQVAAQPLARRYLRWVTYFTPEQKQGLYTPEFRARLGEREAGAWLLRQFADVRREGCNHLDALLATDVRSYLPYDLLVKMDIATMASSLEARSPFLDHQVMEFAARLPARYKLRGTTLKYLLKKVARKLLPAEILDRRKMGFGMPVGNWMRGELRPLLDDVLLSPRALARGYFRPEAVRQLVKENAQGPHDHSNQLWALLWLELWHQEFLD
ncbi:MAG: asparagine synthase (glutamine-hydrolyzing) [Isosphaeraceae bacterium]|jgi:asparagine synthase (glutamine-hydrolysing)